jgi:hypothetical protein
MGEEGPVAEQWEARVFGLGILFFDHAWSIPPWAEVSGKDWGRILQGLEGTGFYVFGGVVFVGASACAALP